VTTMISLDSFDGGIKKIFCENVRFGILGGNWKNSGGRDVARGCPSGWLRRNSRKAVRRRC
jgi:hypothetical protein